MVESIAIMEYLMARHGPTPLAPDSHDPAFPAYQQFLHLGEAGLAMPNNVAVASQMLAPEVERQNWTVRWALEIFESRRRLVARQLDQTPYLAGDKFTAADISVTYSLEFAQRTGNAVLDKTERDYVARTTGREAYKRAMNTCQATKEWASKMSGL